jgi:hypothetical protein
MGDPHDRLKIVQAFEPDLAHARHSRIAASSFGGFRTPAAGLAASFFKRMVLTDDRQVRFASDS